MLGPPSEMLLYSTYLAVPTFHNIGTIGLFFPYIVYDIKEAIDHRLVETIPTQI